MALNHYVTKNGENYQFCFTPNCQGIGIIQEKAIDYVKERIIECDVCQKSYCVLCQVVFVLFRIWFILDLLAMKLK